MALLIILTAECLERLLPPTSRIMRHERPILFKGLLEGSKSHWDLRHTDNGIPNKEFNICIRTLMILDIVRSENDDESTYLVPKTVSE